jgi:hypothetical protein
MYVVQFDPAQDDAVIIPHVQGNLCASCAEDERARMRIRLRLKLPL